jgi:hypothetical protein
MYANSHIETMGLPDKALFNNEPLIRRVPGICSNTYTSRKKFTDKLFLTRNLSKYKARNLQPTYRNTKGYSLNNTL